MITDSQRVGDDCERGIHCPTRAEEAGIDNIQVIEFVRFAVAIECAGLRIVSKTDRAVLVCNASQRNALAEEQVAGEETFMALVSMDASISSAVASGSQLFDQPLVAFLVVWLVLQNDLAVAVERDPIVRVGQILGGEPEIERMFAHQIQRPFRRDFRSAGLERVAVELADK